MCIWPRSIIIIRKQEKTKISSTYFTLTQKACCQFPPQIGPPNTAAHSQSPPTTQCSPADRWWDIVWGPAERARVRSASMKACIRCGSVSKMLGHALNRWVSVSSQQKPYAPIFICLMASHDGALGPCGNWEGGGEGKVSTDSWGQSRWCEPPHGTDICLD